MYNPEIALLNSKINDKNKKIKELKHDDFEARDNLLGEIDTLQRRLNNVKNKKSNILNLLKNNYE